MQDTIVREALQAGGGKEVEQRKLNTLITRVGKSDDIKSVNNIFRSPVTSWKEVGRVDCCMKCEKS
jgi:hypothetical protein